MSYRATFISFFLPDPGVDFPTLFYFVFPVAVSLAIRCWTEYNTTIGKKRRQVVLLGNLQRFN
jgi:hypothetical protein